MRFTPQTKIEELPGVGEKRAALFAKLGIRDVGGLLRHFPRGYQNRGDLRRAAEASDGEIVSMLLTVGARPVSAMLRARMLITKFPAFDDSGSCNIVFFNNRYVERTFAKGEVFRFFGKFSCADGRRSLTNPAYERVVEGVPLRAIVPVYPLTAALTQRIISNLINELLDRIEDADFPSLLPERVIAEAGLCSTAFAYRAIHRPLSLEDAEKARQYFVFEELYSFASRVCASKRAARQGTAPSIVAGADKMAEFAAALPYEMTGAQKRAVGEIAADLASGKPMRRLLAGDVGSGKTVCAAAAAFIVINGGYQAAMMAPTEILARQHYDDLAPFFEKFGIKTALFTGSATQKQKNALRGELASGEIRFAVGTHALISEGVEFSGCALVITDEQHRFGVGQRDALADKGLSDGGEEHAHTLVMSATPIPRSLAMTIYGDLDLSTLDELPPGRQPVNTYAVSGSYLPRLDRFIEKQAAEGGRAYVVCPAVDKSDEAEGEVIQFGYGYDAEQAANSALPMCSAVEEAKRLSEELNGLRVGCVYGKMKAADKDAVMTAFSTGELDVLVSTTVIEVGINVPEATLMIVRNAERFGLSQLHQLRGRVGRGRAKSYCVLVSDTQNEVSKARLDAMKKSSNGFEIAERDLELRGPGDFLSDITGSVRQSGEFRFRFASLASDTETLREAFRMAAENQ